MQKVSEAWKAAQKETFVPESYVELSVTVADPDALLDATASDNQHDKLSNVAETVDGISIAPTKYATLELNQWVLDKSCVFVTDASTNEGQGYIGDTLSGEDGVFSEVPTITISFGPVYETIAPGITIKWSETYNEWASSYRVTAYNGTDQVSQNTVTDNTDVQSVLFADITHYDRITVEVLKWSMPYHRARIESILIGVEQTYTKADILEYQASQFVSPLSTELPKAEITFSLSNLNYEFNPDNPQGMTRYLMDRQLVTVRYGLKLDDGIEWISGGEYFMSDWDTPQNGITASFSARDVLEYMNETYSGITSGSLYDIAESALTQANLPKLTDGSVRWSIDESLKSIAAASGSKINERTIGEVIQLCANAACCVMYQDRGGVLRIGPLPAGTTDYSIDQDNSYENSKLKLTKQLKSVTVNKDYTLTVGDVGTAQNVENDLITADRAPIIAKWIADYLVNRRTLTGSFRADPRLDALDRVSNSNQFATSTVLVTEIQYKYNGAFRGEYAGRTGV